MRYVSVNDFSRAIIRHRDPFEVVPFFESTFTADNPYWLKALAKAVKELSRAWNRPSHSLTRRRSISRLIGGQPGGELLKSLQNSFGVVSATVVPCNMRIPKDSILWKFTEPHQHLIAVKSCEKFMPQPLTVEG
jgi:hypothetical protein